MGAEKILRNTGLLAASGVVALALAVLPVAPGLDAGFAGLKTAQAAGNGGGNGNGNSGNAGSNGNGHGGGVASAGANSLGNGHGKPDGAGVTTAGGQGINATTVGHLKGNLNAYHASVMAFKNAAPNSMVGQISAAITDNQSGTEEENLAAQKAALAELSNQPVDEDVLDAVHDIVSDKVEAAAEVTVETDESEETNELDET